MNTDNQTQYQPTDSQTQYQSADTQLQSDQTVAANPQEGGRWKLITMGGAAGILVGAGALYAGTALAGNSDDVAEVSLEKGDDDVVTLDVEQGADEAVQTDDAQAGAAQAIGAQGVAAQAAQDAQVAVEAGGTTINVNVNLNGVEEVSAEQPAEQPAEVEQKAVLFSEVGHVEIYSEAPIAQSVDDSMTFSEAFAAAREEVGPGGVFHYRGGDYGTYYADEWQAMTPEEREMYADSVHPEVPVEKVDVPTDNANDITINININGTPVEPVVEDKQPESDTDTQTDTDAEGMEVTFEGYAQVTTPGGDEVNVLGLTVEGQEVAFVDVDGDNQFDYAIADVDGDGQIGQGEVLDLNTGQEVDLSMLDMGMEDPTLTADGGDIDMGGDFINDADVQFG